MNPLRIPGFVVRGVLSGITETILAAADTIESWRAFRDGTGRSSAEDDARVFGAYEAGRNPVR